MERDLRKKHIIRLNENKCTGAAGIIYVDIVSNLERDWMIMPLILPKLLSEKIVRAKSDFYREATEKVRFCFFQWLLFKSFIFSSPLKQTKVHKKLYLPYSKSNRIFYNHA